MILKFFGRSSWAEKISLLWDVGFFFAIAANRDAKVQIGTLLSGCIIFSQVIVVPQECSDLFQNIEKLEISHSKVDPGLFRMLPSGLKELSLDSVTDLQGNILSIRHFFRDAQPLQNLKILRIKNQGIDDTEVFIMTQIPGLKILDLSHNHITGRGFWEIAKMPGLEQLDLSYNQTDFLEDAMPGISGIRRLSLRNNQIGNTGVSSIAKIRRITNLDLPSNRIGDVGAFLFRA